MTGFKLDLFGHLTAADRAVTLDSLVEKTRADRTLLGMGPSGPDSPIQRQSTDS